MSQLYNLLTNKTILEILNGDREFGEIGSIPIKMPYLTGSNIRDISDVFGLEVEVTTLSRWEYMRDLIKHCILNNKTNQLLLYLFSKKQFTETLNGLTPKEIEENYTYIINVIVEQISGILYFSENEFVIINNQFIVRPINNTIEIKTHKIKVIDREYIKGLADRASNDIDENNFDSAITKCRTLVEEVFCYVIELKNEVPSDSGKINVLYSQVKKSYNMHTAKEVDRRINMLLSGLEKIITSITQMRNNDSDSHGVGSRRINIEEHHARLYLNASMMVSDFILEIANQHKKLDEN